MPWLSPRPCPYVGCGVLIRGPQRYCDEHLGVARRGHDQVRPSAAARGYDGDWRRRRALFLVEHPDCKMCSDPADVVDHIVPLRQGGEDRESNWQALCTPCHSGPKQRRDRARRRQHAAAGLAHEGA